MPVGDIDDVGIAFKKAAAARLLSSMGGETLALIAWIPRNGVTIRLAPGAAWGAEPVVRSLTFEACIREHSSARHEV